MPPTMIDPDRILTLFQTIESMLEKQNLAIDGLLRICEVQAVRMNILEDTIRINAEIADLRHARHLAAHHPAAGPEAAD